MCVCVSECTTDVVFLVDDSGSIADADPLNFGRVRAFVNAMVNVIHSKDGDSRFALVRFSTNVTTDFSFNNFTSTGDLYLREVQQAVAAMPYEGMDTFTSGGLRQAYREFDVTKGDRPGVGNTLIVITDGVPTVNMDDVDPATEALKNGRSAHIIAVGIGSGVSEALLRQLSSDGDDSHKVENFVDLERSSLLQNLVEDICFEAHINA